MLVEAGSRVIFDSGMGVANRHGDPAADLRMKWEWIKDLIVGRLMWALT